MSHFRLITVSLSTLIATLSISSALAGDCTATPVHSSDGTYVQCEVIHGEDIEFQAVEDVPEAACNTQTMCGALSEIDEMAKESHDLDVAAGVAP